VQRRRALELGRADAQQREGALGRDVRRRARRARPAHQPLGDDERERGGDEERLDAHVDQAGHGGDGVVGVQGRQHQVTGEGRLQRELGGLLVADLADEDDVGVLAQDRAQPPGERQPGALLHLHLRDAPHLHLDGVLERDDVAVRRRHLLDGGVQRVRLAGAGRAGDEHEALRLHQRCPQQVQLRTGQAGLVEVRHVVGARQEADDDLLAVQRRQGGDACLDHHAVDGELRAAVLRTPALGDVEAGHDLDAADGGGRRVARDGHDVAQQAVDAVADAQLVGLRLDVDVGGAGADGVGEHHVDEPDDRRRLDALRRDLLDLALAGVDALEHRRHVGGVLRQRPRAGQVVAHLAVDATRTLSSLAPV
jgi:hypothetical protein